MLACCTALGAHSGFLRRLTTHLEGTGREIIADRVASEVVQRQVDGLPNIRERQIAGMNEPVFAVCRCSGVRCYIYAAYCITIRLQDKKSGYVQKAMEFARWR